MKKFTGIILGFLFLCFIAPAFCGTYALIFTNQSQHSILIKASASTERADGNVFPYQNAYELASKKSVVVNFYSNPNGTSCASKGSLTMNIILLSKAEHRGSFTLSHYYPMFGKKCYYGRWKLVITQPSSPYGLIQSEAGGLQVIKFVKAQPLK